MSKRVVLGSHNAGKLAELQRMLRAAAPDWTVLSLDDYPELPDVAETETSFAGNALLKARSACLHTGEISIGDDSGLCVDILGGMPGILSARWAGAFGRGHGDDDRNIELLLSQIADLPDSARTAFQHCTVAIVWPSGREEIVTGDFYGRISRDRRGTGGFGYDSVFLAGDGDRTTAQMESEEKDGMSHRGIAMRKAVDVLLAG